MDMPSFDLTGKVALVTGASRGIGLAIAEAFASAGARVVLASRKQAALEQAADKIRAAGGEALPIAAHTGDPDAVRLLASEIQTRYGGLDILVNNAGTNPHFGPILSAEESHWDKTLEVNLKGYFRVIKACVDGMRQRGGGKIINVASVAGLEAQPGLGVYGVSKAGVLMLTRLLAIVDQIPVRRVGQPEELTGIALYLASRASDFTTGAVFVVDGGQTAGRAPLPNSD